MAQPLRIESAKNTDLLTIKTRAARLWLVNNELLHEKILAYLARYRERYEEKLYAFVIQGNHYHSTAIFPKANRAHFMRDLNSMVARLAIWNVPGIEEGKFWARRYANQLLPRNEDIENWFFYCALQPVKAGLVSRISEYPGYNSFHDAISGIERKFKVVNWTAYNNAKRFNPKVKLSDYTTIHVLKYERLPGYEHLTQNEYKKLMLEKLEERRQAIIEARNKEGKSFLGKAALLATKPGTKPYKTKKSTRDSKRPLVLSTCPKTKKEGLAQYFDTSNLYHQRSRRYLSGEEYVEFPPGTYKPPLFLVYPP